MIPAFVQAVSTQGFTLRSSMSPSDVQIVENKQPGFTARALLGTQSRIYGQLRKRYLVDTLGQSMGPPSGTGITPPPISFVGVPARGDIELQIMITTGGVAGVAVFSWQDNSAPLVNGQVPIIGPVTTGPLVALAGTGVSILFPLSPASYDPSNVYTAQTPVPDVMIRWIVDMTTPRVFERRGVHPSNDDAIKLMFEREATAAREVADAANSETGLFDLPLNTDTGGSGVTAPAPIAHSQASPYHWMNIQRARGRREDNRGGGGGFGNPPFL
jgi:hypothetical protein